MEKLDVLAMKTSKNTDTQSKDSLDEGLYRPLPKEEEEALDKILDERDFD